MNKMLYRVNEAAEVCSLGRTKTYELINRGLLRSVRIDGAVRVPLSAIEEFVRELEGQVKALLTLPPDATKVALTRRPRHYIKRF
jgi:excisionase family DNA binding protein